VRLRAELLYRQLDASQPLRQQSRRELVAEGRKHPASGFLEQIPCVGPIRAALLIAMMQTPYRFRTKRQLWAYTFCASLRVNPVKLPLMLYASRSANPHPG
jgi:transposase